MVVQLGIVISRPLISIDGLCHKKEVKQTKELPR